MIMKGKEYAAGVLEVVEQRNPGEPEFLNAVREVLHSTVPVFDKNPRFIEAGILERLTEPDRMIYFRVPWVDDQGNVHVNRGYRVQFNAAIGPYKGGLRFHPSVNQSIMKFLGFEQTFKNGLTGLPIGGGKGGADFDPKGKSDHEVMRFCQSFMAELYKYIGPDVDVPAGDIGVGPREIGYLYGYYSKLKSVSEQGVLTGKHVAYGGSHGRPAATGYGLIYLTEALLRDNNLGLEGKKVVVSGSGNVAIHAIEKAQDLGAKVIACSDSGGFIVDKGTIRLDVVKEIKEVRRGRIKEYVQAVPGAKYYEGCRGIWDLPCDIALPCATQGEIDAEAARTLLKNGVEAVVEGANMPCTLEAMDIFLESPALFAPSKMGNAGGVACSALEMTQNSMRYNWTADQVSAKLQDIMMTIYYNGRNTAAEYGHEGNLVVGANIAGLLRVATAMTMQGVV